MTEWCTDKYGNLNCKVGDVVEDDLTIFTVGKIHDKGNIPWFVSMDKNKPFKVKKEYHPMAVCVRSGNYAVIASRLNKANFSV